MSVSLLYIVWVLAMTMALVSLVVALNFSISNYERTKEKSSDVLLSSLPRGTKLYNDTFTGRKCKRCNVGRIAVRKRYKTGVKDNEKFVLSVLARVYWCDQCNFRNSSLENDDT